MNKLEKGRVAKGARRHWRTPPPLTRTSEPLEGLEILREFGTEAGILLWQSYRNVMLWAATDEGDRATLFAAEAGARRLADVEAADLPGALRGPLSMVARMLADPAGIASEEVSGACLALAEWAKTGNARFTELFFTQAAALALPLDAALALAVGRISRERGEDPRAETWFRHAITVSRQSVDWDSYGWAYLALGNMLVQRGNFPAAQRMHIKALRAARRRGLPHIAGAALHDLFVIATETGRSEQAEDLARKAFRAYGTGHPRLPCLAHDIAYYWMNAGHFARALPVFQALQHHITAPAEQLLVQAHLARAAGGAGARDVFRKAWVEVTRAANEAPVERAAAGALLELAEGAASLMEWDRAEQAAERALRVAQARGEAKVASRAESVLSAVANGRRLDAPAARSAPDPIPLPARAEDAFAASMVRSLEGTARAG